MTPQDFWAQWALARQRTDDAERRQEQNTLRQIGRTLRQATATQWLDGLMRQPWTDPSWASWFWFNHFNVLSSKAQIDGVIGHYVFDTVAAHAQGRFVDLLRAVTLHPAMLMYLDNVRNNANRGNENLARELLELHTLGVGGGYTQADVQATARVLSGWGVDMSDSGASTVLRKRQHDMASKTVLGRSYQSSDGQELHSLIDALAAHPATARHLCNKLAVWWLGDAPPAAAVQTLVHSFERSGGDLAELWRTAAALREQHPQARPFKEPLRYVCSGWQALAPGSAPLRMDAAVRWLNQLGQPLLDRATPDGYPVSGSAWANAGQLQQRMDWAQDVTRWMPNLSGQRPWRPEPPSLPTHTRAATRQVVQASASPAQAWALWLCSPDFMFA